MIIYQALELTDDAGKGSGKFHYCMYSDESSMPPMPVGGCAENCPGHSTKEGAELHYKEWQVDHAATLNIMRAETKKQCQVCQEWTQLRATVGREFFEEFVLCEQHNTLDYLRSLYLQ